MTKPRLVLRQILKILSRIALTKHSQDVIIITGDGQTSVLREYLYFILKSKHPVRRNLEIPESEFSVPLTVLGELKYPANLLEWIIAIAKTSARLIKNAPFKHTLILELSSINKNAFDFWIKCIRPRFVISVNTTDDLLNKETLPSVILSKAADILRFYEISELELTDALDKVFLPSPRLSVTKGANNSLIIDSRHFYYPAPLSATLELADSLGGRKVIFTSQDRDLKELAETYKELLVNPANFTPQENDIVIIRGEKSADYGIEIN